MYLALWLVLGVQRQKDVAPNTFVTAALAKRRELVHVKKPKPKVTDEWVSVGTKGSVQSSVCALFTIFINDAMQRWKTFHQIFKSQRYNGRQIQWMAESGSKKRFKHTATLGPVQQAAI